MPRIPTSRRPIVAFPICWRGRRRQVSLRLFIEPPACAMVDCTVVFFNSLQTLVLFAVLLVDCEEWFCSLLGSLPSARHAIVCILFSLEQNQVVDLMVVEHRLDSIWGSNVSNFDFWQILLRRMNDPPKAILSCSIICSSVHPIFYKDFRFSASSCLLSSMDLSPPCFGWRAFCNISFTL